MNLYVKSTVTPVSILEIYAIFLKLLQASSSVDNLPYFWVGAHLIREWMARNQGLNFMAAGRRIAGYYPNLKDLDLKWDTNRLKEALFCLLLALEDARPEMVLDERATLREMRGSMKRSFCRNLGYVDEKYTGG